MRPYQAVISAWANTDDRLLDIVKLDAGENPYGCSPAVLACLKKFTAYNIYPDSEYRGLRLATATYTNTDPRTIMMGNGSDELLDLLLRAILNEDDEIIDCPPTFSMYAVLTRLNRGTLISVSRKKNFLIDTRAIMKAMTPRTKAVIICSPNNPTGNSTPLRDIKQLLQTGKLVVVDEAYFEFSDETVVPLLSEFPNLIVLRTLSKWAGLAGLRVGYMIANPNLISELMKIKPPYNVNVAAVVAARATLENPQPSLKTVATIVRERQRMTKFLKSLPSVTVYPSRTNSLFIQINNKFVVLQKYLTQNNIAVRYYSDSTTGTAIRLTIGTRMQNDTVMRVLQTFFAISGADSIIFDMDGVLIANNAYETAIMQTVRVVLNKPNLSAVTLLRYIRAVKSVPGFNNDWDTTYAIVRLLRNAIPVSVAPQRVAQLTRAARKSVTYKKLKDIFQSYYLGFDLFQKIYKRAPVVSVNNGLITGETCLINRKTLDALTKTYALGIATSRPRSEALFAIQNAGLTKYFPDNVIVAREDVRKEKPAPDPLWAVQKILRGKMSLYVGDTVNDVLAAKNAGMPSIIVGASVQGDFSITNSNALMEVLI